MQHEVCARCMKPPADGGADAFGPTGDQHDFALHAAPRLHCFCVCSCPWSRESNTSMRVSPAEPATRELPLPGPDALDHSSRVTDFVRNLVTAGNGWISFADYMNAVLYAPGLGYYAAGARKFGAAGDFVTAPEITPLFGRTLAASVSSVLDEVDGDVIELGPGSGQLAVD